MIRPFILIVIAFVLGILVLTIAESDYLFWLFFSMTGILVTLFLLHLKLLNNAVLLFLLSFFSSFIIVTIHDVRHESQLSEWIESKEEWNTPDASVTVNLKGRIITRPVRDGDKVRFTLRTTELWLSKQKIETKGDRIALTIQLTEEKEIELLTNIKQGVLIQAPVTMTRPSGARNPGAFDYAQYLSTKRIYWVGKTDGIENVLYKKPSLLNYHYFSGQFREYLYERIQLIFPDQIEELMSGLLIGIDDDINIDLEKDFALLGIIHIMAISGMNVALIIGGMYWVLMKIGLTRERAIIITALFIPLYVVLTGAAPPVMRAGIMALIALIAMYKHKRFDRINVLFFAGFFMLIFEPLLLFQVSFQLSFVVTLGLLLWVPRLTLTMNWLKPDWLRSLLVITFVAQIVSFPMMIYYFNQFSLLSWLANLLIVPIFSVIIIPLGYLALVIGLLHPALAALLSVIITVISQWIEIGAGKIATLSSLHQIWATPSWIWIICYTVICVIVLELSIRIETSRRVKIFLFVSYVFIVFVAYHPFQLERNLRITFLDVGQGDSIFIELPSGHTMLIDAGGTPIFQRDKWKETRDPYEVGKDVVLPFLMHRGIRDIDTVILSHGDYDHVGGLYAVMEKIKIKRILGSPISEENATEQKLSLTVQNLAIPYTVPYPGMTEQIDKDVRLTFIHPDINSYKENNQSIVFLLDYKDKTFLFTGDIEEEIEYKLLRSFQLSDIDVLKVAHHGSKTSTSIRWLESLTPTFAVISAGKNNLYGHPSADILERLHSMKTNVMRTDLQGAISFLIDKNGKMTIETMTER